MSETSGETKATSLPSVESKDEVPAGGESKDEAVLTYDEAVLHLKNTRDKIAKDFQSNPNNGSCYAKDPKRETISVKKLLIQTEQHEDEYKFVCQDAFECIKDYKLAAFDRPKSAVYNANTTTNQKGDLHSIMTFGLLALEDMPFSILAREFVLGSTKVKSAAGACLMGVADLLLWDWKQSCLVLADVKCMESNYSRRSVNKRFAKRNHLLQLHLYAHLLRVASGDKLRIGYLLVIGYDCFDAAAGRIVVLKSKLFPDADVLFTKQPKIALEEGDGEGKEKRKRPLLVA